MKKWFVRMICVVLLSTSHAYAVAPLPTQPVTVEQRGTAEGDPLTIFALVYNSQPEALTITVEFKAGEVLLGKKVVLVSPRSATTVEQDWKLPSEHTAVIARITSALNAKKIEQEQLLGPVGTVNIGTEVKELSSTDYKKTAYSYYIQAKTFIESIRVVQATHFARLRDTKKVALGLKSSTEVEESPDPQFGAPADESTKNAAHIDNPMDYGTLIVASGLATFFGNQLMFYSIGILIIFFFFRFFFRMFV